MDYSYTNLSVVDMEEKQYQNDLWFYGFKIYFQSKMYILEFFIFGNQSLKPGKDFSKKVCVCEWYLAMECEQKGRN